MNLVQQEGLLSLPRSAIGQFTSQGFLLEAPNRILPRAEAQWVMKNDEQTA